MKNKIIICISILVLIFLTCIFLLSNKKNTKTNRYDEIKEDINKELERYLYVVQPKCQKGSRTTVTHKELVYNAGFDKEKLLDVDKKSYCMVYIPVKCMEEGKLKWKIYLSCNDYKDKGFVKWANPFSSKE